MNEKASVTLCCVVLTVSGTRTAANDPAGDLLAASLEAAGHRVMRREIVFDDVYQLRRAYSECIADPQIQVVLSTGGTGFSRHNSVPEAVGVLLDRDIPGFGELFRQLSYNEIGSAAIQSRCLGGYANGTLIFCLPGSAPACGLAWTHILRAQLDHRTRPCNFAGRA